MTEFFVTEISGKLIANRGWCGRKDAAFAAAREAVCRSTVPAFVAVIGDGEIELRVARDDHELARHADEIIAKPLADLPADAPPLDDIPDPPAPGADDY